MSMCHIGYRAGGRTGVSHLHYAQGVLDWSSYHAHHEREARKAAAEYPEGSATRTHLDEMAALHVQAKLAFTPTLNIGGCEREAGRNGFWRCDTPEAGAAWRRHARSCDRLSSVPLGRCALLLDFDRRHATIRDRGFCDWEHFLPDGWTHEFAEMPEGAAEDG